MNKLNNSTAYNIAATFAFATGHTLAGVVFVVCAFLTL